MIKYTLTCEIDHRFEGWFRNSDDFDAQCARNLVACPVCGSTDVKKTLMAPAVSTARKKASIIEPVEPTPAPAAENSAVQQAEQSTVPAVTQTAAMLPGDVKQKEIIEALRVLRNQMVENSENVGKDFASEARKIHYGEAEERSIYGETTPQDAEELLDEGISVIPLPDLPDDKN